MVYLIPVISDEYFRNRKTNTYYDCTWAIGAKLHEMGLHGNFQYIDTTRFIDEFMGTISQKIGPHYKISQEFFYNTDYYRRLVSDLISLLDLDHIPIDVIHAEIKKHEDWFSKRWSEDEINDMRNIGSLLIFIKVDRVYHIKPILQYSTDSSKYRYITLLLHSKNSDTTNHPNIDDYRYELNKEQIDFIECDPYNVANNANVCGLLCQGIYSKLTK